MLIAINGTKFLISYRIRKKNTSHNGTNCFDESENLNFNARLAKTMLGLSGIKVHKIEIDKMKSVNTDLYSDRSTFLIILF